MAWFGLKILCFSLKKQVNYTANWTDSFFKDRWQHHISEDLNEIPLNLEVLLGSSSYFALSCN